MILEEIYDRFANDAPVPAMTRAALENCFAASELDRIFRENSEQQVEGDLLFSTVVDVLQLAVLRGRSSLNAAYNDKKAEIGISVKSVYDKLAGVETNVSRSMVQETGKRMRHVIEAIGGGRETLKGYRVKIADGKHLDRTDRRLKPLREINGAPLPGQLIAVLDADARVVVDVVPAEDGHAQERSLLGELEQSIESKDLWIADRNFCTIGFLNAIAARKACFVIRRHGNLHPRPLTERKRVTRGETGVIYQQQVVIGSGNHELKLRMIEVDLDKPTRDGAKSIAILTNLPGEVPAARIAQLYRGRWTIEQAFQHIAQALNAEIKTLAYPKAALLGFCIALVAANIMSVLKTAIATATDRDYEQLSTYYLADEIKANYGGMMVILPPQFWNNKFSDLTPKQLARELTQMAKQVPQHRFQKANTRKKGPPNDVGPKTNRPHISTKRVLDEHYR